MSRVLPVSLVCGLAFLAEPVVAQPADRDQTLELAKKTQNPVANLISVPFQNNLNFGYGAKDTPEPSSTQFILNIQPVVPLTLGADWNLIMRPIVPIMRQPDLLKGGDTWGLGDTTLQTYLSPSRSG